MKLKNLYFAQLGKAIYFAQNDIFEYKRLSLILFDNIIENLLRTQNCIKLRHLLVLGIISKETYEKTIKGFEHFKNIIVQARKLDLITENEIDIFNFCHSARNNLYHNLFEDNKKVEFSILFYSKYLVLNMNSLLEIGITSYSDEEFYSKDKILSTEQVNNYDELISKLNLIDEKKTESEQQILCNKLLIYLDLFESFYESEANESWSKFNEIIRNQYYYGLTIQSIKNEEKKITVSLPKQTTYMIDDKRISRMKSEINQMRNLNIGNAFKKFTTLNSKLEPLYIQILLYNAEQETHINSIGD